jgi:photosystem II stability/assembly factor-like uncharacterized protein
MMVKEILRVTAIIGIVCLLLILEPFQKLQAQELVRVQAEGKWTCWNDGTVDPCHRLLKGIVMLSEQDGWSIGEQGKAMHWDGARWRQVATGITHDLIASSFVTTADGWAVGAKGTILHWDGTIWQTIASPTNVALHGIHMISSSDGWVVGDSGVILHWDGSIWSSVPSPTTANLRAIDMVAANDGWAVGFGGTVLRYDGSIWSQITGNSGVLLPYLFDITMISASDGWIVGDAGDGLLVRWDGSQWKRYEDYRSEVPVSIAMVSSTRGWLATREGEILHWDGTSWQTMVSPVVRLFAKSSYKVEVTETGSLWVVGVSDLVWRYRSGDWTTLNKPPFSFPLADVSIVSAHEAWAVGIKGGIPHFYKGTWQAIPTPL